jgi:hypothetical protein
LSEIDALPEMELGLWSAWFGLQADREAQAREEAQLRAQLRR